jgi:hypothetical protein
METIEIIERSIGKTRLGQPEKMKTFLNLIAENADVASIYKELGLK